MPRSEIIDRTIVVPNKAQVNIVERLYGQNVIEETIVEKITYQSDGLKVKGYLACPKQSGLYPVLIWNRGGTGDRGALDDLRAYLILASTARWGYVVMATQYRGNRGSEGHEDWGDKDVNDALALLEIAEDLPDADTSRVGIEGASRGGMTTYRALSMENQFKCAIVHAGVADLFELEKNRLEFGAFIEKMFGHLPPEEKQRELALRSAVYFADRLPHTCPILLLHGDADTQVPVAQSVKLAAELKKHGVPYRLVIIEGGGHVALKDGSYKEIDVHRQAWLKQYLG